MTSRERMWMLRFAFVGAALVGSGAALAETVEEKAAVCGACHGLKGVPEDKSIPIIWGQNAAYLYLQFRDFQNGTRKDDRMSAVARNVVKEDALALAEYFAAKPWPRTGAPAASEADAEIANATNAAILCTTCHRQAYQGDASVPRLAGQQEGYLAKTLMDLRSRRRANNPGMSGMTSLATPEQLAAMAAYLAGL
jgi:cytochrome c553